MWIDFLLHNSFLNIFIKISFILWFSQKPWKVDRIIILHIQVSYSSKRFSDVSGDTETLKNGGPNTQPSEAVHSRKFQGPFRNLENKLGVNNRPRPILSLQLQLPVKIRKIEFLMYSLLRLGRAKFTFVSFGQEIALQGRGHLKINLTAPPEAGHVCRAFLLASSSPHSNSLATSYSSTCICGL